MAKGIVGECCRSERQRCTSIYSYLKVALHGDSMMKKAFGIVAFISKANEYRSWTLQLYKMLVMLYFGFSFCRPASGKMPLRRKK